MSRAREWLLTVAAGLLLAGLLAIRIDAPWRFVHDDNGVFTQAVATAHLRAGLARTRGQDFLLRRADGALVPYLHHPPLYPLATAAGYAASGRSDPLVTRLIPAGFHLLGFLGFGLLSRVLFPASPGRRLLAAFTYAVVPMSSFFGKMPFNEAMGLCWVVWGTACLAAARAGPSPRPGWLAASCGFWVLAGLTSWPAYAVLFALGVLVVIEDRGSGSPRTAIALAATALGTLAVVLAQLAWAGGLDRLLSVGGFWGAGLGDARLQLASVGRAFNLHRLYFANLPTLLLLIWLALALRRAVRGGGIVGALPPAHRWLLAGAAGCALWALAFARQVSVHGYGQFWFLPFESLAAADLSVRGWQALAGRPALRRALAATGALIVLGSTATTLVHRYTRPGVYALQASASLQATYETRP